jgi:hypothetical protein
MTLDGDATRRSISTLPVKSGLAGSTRTIARYAVGCT